MMINLFGSWNTLFAAHASEPDPVAEVPVAAEAEAIARQYRGTPMPVVQPKAVARSPKNLSYRGTSYTR